MTLLNVATALPDEAFALDVTAADWRQALRIAGNGLISSGAATSHYTDEMIDAVDRLGPYIVISPGIALAHSRPSPAVLRTGMSWTRLAVPVKFGHARNDPVGLVIGLAACDENEHLEVLAAISSALGNECIMEQLHSAPDPQTIRAILVGEEAPHR